MDAMRAASGVPSSLGVHERNGGGNKRQADAFRRALADGSAGGGQGAGPDGGPSGAAAKADEGPVRRRLQPAPAAGRKDEGPSRHVDVIA